MKVIEPLTSHRKNMKICALTESDIINIFLPFIRECLDGTLETSLADFLGSLRNRRETFLWRSFCHPFQLLEELYNEIF